MKEALFCEKQEDGSVLCNLCPHNCHIKSGKLGSCRVRKNIGGRLFSENYSKVSAVHFDPLEKKPLYHYFPGKIIFSIGSIGCNLHCDFCQNAEISQSCFDDFPYAKEYSSQDIIDIALTNRDNIGVAYTYNEPIIWYEYMLDTARIAKEKNLKNVMVTNGFVSIKPLEGIMSLVDAFSVDLKAFTEEFYRKITHSRLEPVKEALKTIRKAGKHLEITNLIIPTLNDDLRIFEEMCKWIHNELGKDTILHLSRYFPTYKMTIDGTPLSTLLELHNIARTYLDYVYLGNVSSKIGNDTACNKCGNTVISRDGYWVSVPGLDADGNCRTCGNRIAVME